VSGFEGFHGRQPELRDSAQGAARIGIEDYATAGMTIEARDCRQRDMGASEVLRARTGLLFGGSWCTVVSRVQISALRPI
jgi:hypothetical protein